MSYARDRYDYLRATLRQMGKAPTWWEDRTDTPQVRAMRRELKQMYEQVSERGSTWPLSSTGTTPTSGRKRAWSGDAPSAKGNGR